MKRICFPILAGAVIGAIVGFTQLHALPGNVTVIHNAQGGKWNGPWNIQADIVGGQSANNVFGTAPSKTWLAIWNVSQGQYDVYTKGGGWPDTLVLEPGSGIWVKTLVNHTFTWDPPPPPQPELILEPDKFYLRGPLFYGAATYEDIVGAPPNDETTLLRYIGDGTTGIEPTNAASWEAYKYEDGEWTPSAPVLDPGEAAFIIHPFLRLKHSITGQPPELVLEWPRGTLEGSDQVAGPWADVAGASSPHQIPIASQTNALKFYRIRE